MEVLVLVLLVGTVFARPDVSHLKGYNYQPPATSYGVPLGSRVNTEDERQYYNVASQHGQQTIPSGSYLPSLSGGLSGVGGSISPQIGLVSTGLTGQISSSTGGSFGAVTGSQSGFDQTFGTPSRFGVSQFDSSFNAQGIKDQKHVYFYAAPDEPQEHRARITVPSAPASKHTKIIFIKAPSYTAPLPPIIAPQPQSEQKTVVYVLVKKPDEQPAISIPAPVPTNPSKPEVYFIKYKSKQEAEQAISGSLSGVGAQGSVSVHPVGGSDEFISQLSNGIGGGDFNFNVNRGSFSGGSDIGSGTSGAIFEGNLGGTGTGSGSIFGGSLGTGSGTFEGTGSGTFEGTGSVTGSGLSSGTFEGTGSVTGSGSSGGTGTFDGTGSINYREGSSGSIFGGGLGTGSVSGGAPSGDSSAFFNRFGSTEKPIGVSTGFFGSGSGVSSSTAGPLHVFGSTVGPTQGSLGGSGSVSSTNFLSATGSTKFGPAGESGPY